MNTEKDALIQAAHETIRSWDVNNEEDMPAEIKKTINDLIRYIKKADVMDLCYFCDCSIKDSHERSLKLKKNKGETDSQKGIPTCYPTNLGYACEQCWIDIKEMRRQRKMKACEEQGKL